MEKFSIFLTHNCNIFSIFAKLTVIINKYFYIIYNNNILISLQTTINISWQRKKI